jgi:hypothetical protein
MTSVERARLPLHHDPDYDRAIKRAAAFGYHFAVVKSQILKLGGRTLHLLERPPYQRTLCGREGLYHLNRASQEGDFICGACGAYASGKWMKWDEETDVWESPL